MSGICAIWRKERPSSVAHQLASVCRGLALDSSERTASELGAEAGVALSSRATGQQIYRDERVLLACDLELLNEKDLARGVGSPKLSGAPLIAVLYEKYGSNFVDKLRGAFSLILFDQTCRQLLAAIDGFGIKRLAYYCGEKVLCIASRVDALTGCSEVPHGINPRAIVNILNYSANLAPETIFGSVKRLIPGALLSVTERELRVQRYWNMRYGIDGGFNEERLSSELEQVLERSVADHFQHDALTDVGAYLSGGTDSSTVLGMMTRAARGPVKSFSIGYQEQEFNELEYAKIAAERFRSEHHTYLVGSQDCFEALPGMIRSFDEPFGNSSAIPTYFCARLAAQNGVKTLLAGDGGDELFGGNERYATDLKFQAYHSIPNFLRKGFIEPALQMLPFENGLLGKGARYVRRANIPGVERMLSYQFLCTHPPGEVFDGDFLAALGNCAIQEIPARHYSESGAGDHLDRLLYVDVKITLADNDLPKVTCMSELAGIQTRFPYLDRSVAEFSGRIPARLKVKGLEKRYLFRRAFRELLPVEILRKKKHGFGIPVAHWMKTDPHMRELLHDTLGSSRALGRGYFRREFIDGLFQKHQAEGSSCYYGDTLWTFLALELWHREVMDQKAKVTA